MRKDEVAVEEMKPWEQHSAVISIPRYAKHPIPSSIVHFVVSSLLVPSKGRKVPQKKQRPSLTRSTNTCNIKEEEDHQNVASKRRKVVVSEKEEEFVNDLENKDLDENTGAREVPEGSPKSDANTERSDPLSPVKLTRSGLSLLTFFGYPLS